MERADLITEFLLRIGDNALILSHRVSEWCGHAPVIEEDIAMANTALDLIGQAQLWLGLAGELEGKGRDADRIAYHRDAWDFRNTLLVERPNGNFGETIMRQFLFDAAHILTLRGLLTSTEPRIAEIAEKSLKEVTYHLERSRDTIVALGDGTPESHAKMQAALNMLYPYVGEMFHSDEVDQALAKAGIAPDPADLRDAYDAYLASVMSEATLEIPTDRFAHLGGKSGKHTEHLGFILADMQFLQRAYPGATW